MLSLICQVYHHHHRHLFHVDELIPGIQTTDRIITQLLDMDLPTPNVLPLLSSSVVPAFTNYTSIIIIYSTVRRVR